ncbi:hypothetical protein BC940DRAFT_36468 [Gongronella butleri]|nr:hypothetical protein BC940DRAFT_36468 [Gongronella butleri]
MLQPWPLAILLPDKPPSMFSAAPTATTASTTQDRKRARATSSNSQRPTSLARTLPPSDVALSPLQKVRRTLDTVVDNGSERVDLSHLDLEEIPDDIAELKHITVLCKDRVKRASLQLYLFGNQLRSLSPALFLLDNLTVLSLRHNLLTSIPPDIIRLKQLVELSVGNNSLLFLPGELLQLEHLQLLSVSTNPLLPAPRPSGVSRSNNDHDQDDDAMYVRPGRLCHRMPSLCELAARALHQHEMIPTASSSNLPLVIHHSLTTLPSECVVCKTRFLQPTIEEMIWVDVASALKVPLLFRFCSLTCCRRYSPKPARPRLALLPSS